MNILYKNAFTVLLLMFVAFSFSGCTIRKADTVEKREEKAVEAPAIDTDGDGLPDSEEKDRGTDIDKKDTDGDGLSDYDEVRKWGTDPLKADTDGDGYDDNKEIAAGYDPLGPGQLQSDRDGLGDADEKKYGTDPQEFDTDGDGLSDKEEIDAGRDPLVAGK